MVLLQRLLDQLPAPARGVFLVLAAVLFGWMAFGIARSRPDERGAAWPLWVAVLASICLLFLWAGIRTIFEG